MNQPELNELAGRLVELLPRLKQRFADEISPEMHAQLRGELSRVTPHQLDIVDFLGQRGPVTMSEIGESLQVSPSAATQQVERLVRLGLAERVPDGEDRRLVRVRLTPGAPELARRHVDLRRQVAARVLARIGVERARLLVELLAEIT